jgi:predicted transcriptional regulator
MHIFPKPNASVYQKSQKEEKCKRLTFMKVVEMVNDEIVVLTKTATVKWKLSRFQMINFA